LPSNISVQSAALPETYENAKTALANCAQVDECQQWANKAEALASYAKQADDDTLRKLADRIQARAVRRCGELLKQYDGRGRPNKNSGGAPPISQRQAAGQAGMSRDQQRQAVNVANVPEDEFEGAVESDSPPTVTQLAGQGRQKRDGEDAPAGFKQATHLIGSVKRFAEFCRQNNPEDVASGVMPSEAEELRKHVSTIDGWLDRFVVNLKGD
jgi:hypothetical protein